jgi:serine/threonine protein kinase
MSGIVSPLFSNGDEFRVRETGQKGKVIGEFGEGGQGQVFKARMDDGTEKALKVYHKHYLSDNNWLQTKIPALVQRGAPSDRFLWPEGTVEIRKDRELFGYVMPLKPPNFEDAVSYLGSTKITYRALLRATTQTARGFEALHARGLCYRDVNWNNVAIHAQDGDSRIVDNDNVDFDSDECQVAIGFPSFIAPEVLKGEYRPSSDSDRHALAVLFYYLFFQCHPLDGKSVLQYDIWGNDDQNQHYSNASYHFNADDKSNEAIKMGEQDPDGLAGHNALYYRKIFPEGFLAHFDRTFSAGLKQRHKRTMESVWRAAFDLLGHQIIHCSNPRCADAVTGARENFYRGEQLHRCYKCKGEIVLPPRIRITPDEKVYVLSHDIQLRGRHIGNTHQRSEKDQVQAVINVHPEKPTLWGLRNDSSSTWRIQTERDGEWTEVPSQKRISLDKPKIVVNFGNGRKGTIRCGPPSGSVPQNPGLTS